MRLRHSTVLATAIPNRAPITEIYIGGAADTHTRLVAAFAEARQAAVSSHRDVHYVPHFASRHAYRLASHSLDTGRDLILIGHSWGCDTALRLAARLSGRVTVLVCADPVSKSRLNRPARPENVDHVVYIDALPVRPNRSDHVKRVGQFIGGTLKRTLAKADSRIMAPVNHFAFADMLHARGPDGASGLDWIDHAGQLNRTRASTTNLAR